MYNYQNVLVRQEQYKDLRRNAEQYRRQKMLLAGQPRRSVSGPAFAWMGNHLVRWGQQMQQRHGAVPGMLGKSLTQ